MAYTTIDRMPRQHMDSSGNLYSGAVLKAYIAGTSTPLSFATDSTGSVLVESIALNVSGYPEVSGNVVIPHVNQNYKLSLYPNQAAADANDNTASIWTVDNLTPSTSGVSASTDNVSIGEVQNSELTYLGTTSGSADAYTLFPSNTITAYAATQSFTVKMHASNATTTPYLQISGIDSPSSTAVIKKLDAAKAEVAVEVGDLLVDGVYQFQRNSGNDAWLLLNPESVVIGGTLQVGSNIGVGLFGDPITIANNATDAEHDIDISAGLMKFDDNTGQAITTALTKQIDNSWVAGNAQGGMDTGAVAADTWYYVYAIYNPATKATDALFTATYGSPTMPTGFTKKQYRGAFRTDGSSNIREGSFLYNPDGSYEFRYDVMIVDRSLSAMPASPTNLTLSSPPNRPAMLNFHLEEVSTGGARYVLFTTTNSSDKEASSTNYTAKISTPGGGEQSNSGYGVFLVDSSGQISIDANSTGVSVSIFNIGWQDSTL